MYEGDYIMQLNFLFYKKHHIIYLDIIIGYNYGDLSKKKYCFSTGQFLSHSINLAYRVHIMKPTSMNGDTLVGLDE